MLHAHAAVNVNHDDIDRTAVLRMIKSGRLTVERQSKFKSDVCDHIYSIKTNDGLVLKSFSQCQTCKTLLSATSSTETLRQHLKSRAM